MADRDNYATPAQRQHLKLVADYARRHYSDPGVRLKDAAAFLDVNERTLRRSLRACGTSWRMLLLDLRLPRARHLLTRKGYEIRQVARLCGYDSPPAFAAAFQKRHEASPAEFRRGQGGPARAGGPTGAFYRPAEQAAARQQGLPVPQRPPKWGRGHTAVFERRVAEAEERHYDRSLVERGRSGPRPSFEELTDIWDPRRMGDEPEYWRARHEQRSAWMAEMEEKRPEIEGREGLVEL